MTKPSTDPVTVLAENLGRAQASGYSEVAARNARLLDRIEKAAPKK